MIRIYNAKDPIEANWIVSFLKEEGIPSYVSGSGTGEYLQIAMGHSVFGMDISVREEDEDRAKEIIDELLKNDNNVLDENEADGRIGVRSGEKIDVEINTGTEEKSDAEIGARSDKKANEGTHAASDEKTENMPWYRDQKITARVVVLSFAIILILLGVLELVMN